MATINNITIDVSKEVLDKLKELEDLVRKQNIPCTAQSETVSIQNKEEKPFVVVDGVMYINEAEISKHMIVSYEGGTHIDTKVHLKPKKQELCVLHSGEGSWVTYTYGSFEFKKGVKS